MLPLPIVLLLLFSATLLAPSSPLLVGFIRTATLQSSAWKTLPAPIPPSTSQPPPEVASLLPVLVPQVPPDTLPTSCGTSLEHVAPNNTVPRLFVHVADDRTTSTAVLLVVSLAMFNCFVYKLMVDEPDEARDTDGEPEQVMVFPYAAIVGSSTQESMCHHTPAIDETRPQLLSVDKAKSISQTVEHERLPHAVTHPSFSSYEVMILSQSPSPLEQSLPFFDILSRDFSVGSSTTKVTGGDKPNSSSAASPASNSASIDPPPTIVTQSTDLEALTTIPVVLTMEIDDPKPELAESILLDTDAAKDDAPLMPDLTMTPRPREIGSRSELHDSPMSSPITGDAFESEADGQDVFCYQSPESEGHGDETFDYKGVDCTPEALGDPQAPATEDSAVPSSPVPSLLDSHHGQSFGHAPSPSANMPSPDDINTRGLSRRTSLPPGVTPRPAVVRRYASDDIQVVMKGQSGSPIVRSASVDDLGFTFKTTKATEVFTISDSLTVISLRGVVDDDSAHNQMTALRAEAPIFNPRGSGVDELVLLAAPQQPDSVGLKVSIHAQNGDISQTRGCVGVSGSMHAIRRACAPATTSESTSDSLGTSETASDSSGGTEGLRASVHAPQHLSTGAHQGLEGNVEESETQLTRSIQLASSSSTDDGPQSGLTGSIHAPRRSPPLEAAQRSSQHSADAPNWAAAARAEDSSTTSGVSVTAQRDDSPDPALDDDGSEVPTATRCAVKDQEEGSVDSSDGSLDYADDQEGTTTTTGSGETDDGLDEADDPNEQDSSPQSRRTRRRGKSRRHRQKAPYLPPPRMRLGNPMQRSVVDGFAAQTRPPNALAAPPPPAPSSGQYYSHCPPPSPHYPTSALRPMAPPPNIVIPNQLGPHPPYHHPRPMGSPHSAGPYPPPIPAFPPPGPYTPTFYPHGPHPQYVSSQAPFIPLYGR